MKVRFPKVLNRKIEQPFSEFLSICRVRIAHLTAISSASNYFLYQIRLHRNDLNGEDGGDGSAVSLLQSIVGTKAKPSPLYYSGAAGIDIM